MERPAATPRLAPPRPAARARRLSPRQPPGHPPGAPANRTPAPGDRSLPRSAVRLAGDRGPGPAPGAAAPPPSPGRARHRHLRRGLLPVRGRPDAGATCGAPHRALAEPPGNQRLPLPGLPRVAARAMPPPVGPRRALPVPAGAGQRPGQPGALLPVRPPPPLLHLDLQRRLQQVRAGTCCCWPSSRMPGPGLACVHDFGRGGEVTSCAGRTTPSRWSAS